MFGCSRGNHIPNSSPWDCWKQTMIAIVVGGNILEIIAVRVIVEFVAGGLTLLQTIITT